MNLELASRSSPVGYGGAPFGVLLLSLGGPQHAADVRPYLEQRLLDQEPFSVGFILRAPLTRWNLWRQARRLRRRMRGGVQRLDPQWAERAAAGVEKRLRLRGRDATVRVGTRFLKPGIEPALVALHAQGLRRLILVLMHPQVSSATTAPILREFRRAMAQSGCLFRTATVESWYADAGYLDLMAHQLQQGLEEFPEDIRRDVRVLFCAEGILDSARTEDVQYVEQVDATVQGIVARLPQAVRWEIGFHAGPGPQRWLGPDMESAVHRLAESGGSHLVCLSLGVADDVESAHDLETVVPVSATQAGFETVTRVAPLADHPRFLDLLSQWIEKQFVSE